MGRKGNKERKKDRSTEANKVMKEVRVPKGNKERRNYKGGRRLGEVKEIRTEGTRAEGNMTSTEKEKR